MKRKCKQSSDNSNGRTEYGEEYHNMESRCIVHPVIPDSPLPYRGILVYVIHESMGWYDSPFQLGSPHRLVLLCAICTLAMRGEILTH